VGCVSARNAANAALKDEKLQGMMKGRSGCASPLFVPHAMKG
jgi:hypothetical protein